MSDPITLELPTIRATLFARGATLAALHVPDRTGALRNVVLGYGSAAEYAADAAGKHSYFGAAIGRYANRIRRGTFTLGAAKHSITLNEGANVVHGGKVGYDQREWAVASQTATSVTFRLDDDGFEGFPGRVIVYATYTISAEPKPALSVVLTGVPLTAPTPLMLTTHSFFCLSGDPSTSIGSDTLHMPFAARTTGVDGELIPSHLVALRTPLASAGPPAADAHPLDFTSPKPIGAGLAAELLPGVHGIDNAFILDRPDLAAATQTGAAAAPLGQAQLTWSSPVSGVRMALYTNQPGLQLFACVGYDGSVVAQAGRVVEFGAMAVEPQGWIDGINHPEWAQAQVFGPETGPAVNVSKYVFDTV